MEEGLKRASIRITPETYKRAKDEWFLEAVNDIINFAKAARPDGLFEVLHTTAVTTVKKNRRRYALPTDFDEGLSIQVLDGSITGTAQSGSASTITFAAADASSQGAVEGNYVFITEGNGKEQLRQILSYNTTTKVATVDAPWDNGKTPASGDTYLVCDEFYEVVREFMTEQEAIRNPQSARRPRAFAEFDDEYIINHAPDKDYPARLRYYANPNRINFTDGKWNRILRDWRSALVEGIRAIALDDQDDDRADESRQLFVAKIQGVIARERPYKDEFEGFALKRIPG